jgi:sec-independent protein translocase protein TatC
VTSSRLPRPGRKRAANPEARMSVIDHLRELRRRLIVVVLILVVGGVVGWFLYDPVISLLKAPYCALPYKDRFPGTPGGQCNLIFTQPLGGYTIRLKVSIIVGAIVTCPFWLYQVWAFITPGLKRNEKKYTYIFIVLSTTLFLIGVVLAYLVLYKGLSVLIGSAGSGVTAFLQITDYVNFVVLTMIIFGVAFELPLIIVITNLVGVLPFKVLKRGQRIGIFLIFLFAAVATPSTDPFTMCAMAFPMVLLFEGAVVFAYFHDRRKAARKALEEQQAALDDETWSDVEALPEPLHPETQRKGPAGDAGWDDVL